WKPFRRRSGDGVRSGEQRVDPGEEAVALRAAGGVAEAIGGEERRSRERLRLEECQVGEAGDAGGDPVHDVECAAAERKREVGGRTDRDAEAAATGDRDGDAERDDLTELAAREGAPAGLELGGPTGGSKHGDLVTAPAERRCRPRDVVVRLVRLRPR